MDFAFIWNRFGQPFRPDLSVYRNCNGADQVAGLNHAAPKTGELAVKVFDYCSDRFAGGSRAVLATG